MYVHSGAKCSIPNPVFHSYWINKLKQNWNYINNSFLWLKGQNGPNYSEKVINNNVLVKKKQLSLVQWLWVNFC